MNTTELIRPPAARHLTASLSDAGHNASASASEHPTFGQALAEIIPLVGAVPGEGPPVIFLAGPWLLLALVLSAPFAFLLTLLGVMLVAGTVVAFTAAILAAPYLLLRRLRRHRARRAFSSDHAAQLATVESTRVPA